MTGQRGLTQVLNEAATRSFRRAAASDLSCMLASSF